MVAEVLAALDALPGHGLVVIAGPAHVGSDRILADRVRLTDAEVQPIDKAALAGHAQGLQATPGCDPIFTARNPFAIT